MLRHHFIWYCATYPFHWDRVREFSLVYIRIITRWWKNITFCQWIYLFLPLGNWEYHVANLQYIAESASCFSSFRRLLCLMIVWRCYIQGLVSAIWSSLWYTRQYLTIDTVYNIRSAYYVYARLIDYGISCISCLACASLCNPCSSVVAYAILQQIRMDTKHDTYNYFVISKSWIPSRGPR